MPCKPDMELLLVSHKYPPATGGMERQSFELVKGLSTITKVHSLVYKGKESRLRFFLQIHKRIKDILIAHPGITIIHYNDGLMAAASLFHRQYQNVKRTATFHGLDVVFPSYLFQKFLFPKFNNFDLVFAVSRATAEACRLRGIDSKKVVVVNNGVDPAVRAITDRKNVDQHLSEKYGIDFHNKKLLIAIGRPVKRKGFSWFISQVLPLIKVDVILLLIGPRQEKKSGLTRLMQRLPSFLRDKAELFLGYPSDEIAISKLLNTPVKHPSVIRTGKLPIEEMNQLLSVADAFIMPNIDVPGDMEGFGLVCLEACMQGARVFAAASGGITDAITDQKNGMLLPSGDHKRWAETLNGVLSGNQAWQITAEEVISFSSNNFSWKKMSEEYFQHFSRL